MLAPQHHIVADASGRCSINASLATIAARDADSDNAAYRSRARMSIALLHQLLEPAQPSYRVTRSILLSIIDGAG